MDPLTHAASGAVAMLALPHRPATFWAAPLAALACASPDLDLLFIHSPLEFLMLHRGLSHSLAFMPFFGLLLACLCWPLWRKATPLAWKFSTVWLFCCAMILLHIWLDVVTTYGTMIFLPFSHYRVRLNSIYIIDLLVTLPLLWAVAAWRAKPKLLVFTLIWTFLYPASGIAINAWHTSQCWSRFEAENKQVANLHVLPDAFAPLFWRVIYEEASESRVTSQSLDFFGNVRAQEASHPAADPKLVDKFIAQSISGDAFFHFAMLPVMENLPDVYLPNNHPDNAKYIMAYDLRFGSGLEVVRKLLALRPNADLPFLFMAELIPDLPSQNISEMQISQLRLRFSDSGRDSQWLQPDHPRPPTWAQWLVGLR